MLALACRNVGLAWCAAVSRLFELGRNTRFTEDHSISRTGDEALKGLKISPNQLAGQWHRGLVSWLLLPVLLAWETPALLFIGNFSSA